MKLYKIKTNDNDIYIQYIIIGVNGIKAVPTLESEEAAIYEEDKANVYLDILNKENKNEFILEECGEI